MSDQTTAAERLRDAATRLREGVERMGDVAEGVWIAVDEHSDLPDAQPAWCVSQMRPGWESMSPTEGYVTDVCETFSDDREHDPVADYIAMMSPPVALALADWLDDVADHDPSPLMPTEAGAFKVADVVLGGERS